MYSKLKKRLKIGCITALLLSIPLSILSVVLYSGEILNLIPKEISYSELNPDSTTDSEKIVILKADYIINTFMEITDNSNPLIEKVLSIGYVGYNAEADKFFGFLVPKSLADTFDKEADRYLEHLDSGTGDFTPNVLEIQGVARKMDDEEKSYFKEILSEHISYELINNYLTENQLDIETISDEEFLNMLSSLGEQSVSEILNEKTDFYLINYRSKDFKIEDYYAPLLMFISPLIVIIIILIPRKYYKFKKLKDKIKENPDFTEFDVEQDFNNSINVAKIWFGNKFTILLAEKNADLLVNENLAWAFILKQKVRRSMPVYYLFTMDFDGNRNITGVPLVSVDKTKQLIMEKCPNACFGYSDELLNIAFEDVNNIKDFDKSTLDKNYKPFFADPRDLIR